MKTASLWIIRVALTVQFLGVLAVPAIVAAAESPRGMWIAEWLAPSESRTSPGDDRLESSGLRPHSIERAIGVLRLRETKLVFIEQVGQAGWELDLASVKRVAAAGDVLLLESTNGEKYLVSIMEAPAKKAGALIERAMQSQTR